MTTVAAFDVDGTLTTRDCVVPFLERLVGRARLAAGMAAHPFALAGAAARRDRDRFKALAVRSAFAGREASRVEALGATYAQMVHTQWMRSDTVRRLAWHQHEGHRVVLVSASLGAYLRPLGALLGVDGVLCTEVIVDAGGHYTGALDGPNCRGPEKVRRLRSWLRESTLDDAELWAYGDSAGDRELLAAARHQLIVKDVVVSAVPAAAEGAR
ncbi:MAG TPA: HAD-IB family hydrolase [Ilumatobacteraceae bacterium]|jgi:phosphatidylglycerophosphatase C